MGIWGINYKKKNFNFKNKTETTMEMNNSAVKDRCYGQTSSRFCNRSHSLPLLYYEVFRLRDVCWPFLWNGDMDNLISMLVSRLLILVTINVSMFLFKNKPSSQRTISHYQRKNEAKVALNCVPGLFSGKIVEEQRHILTFSDNLKNICRGRIQDVKLFPVCKALLIIWIELLR